MNSKTAGIVFCLLMDRLRYGDRPAPVAGRNRGPVCLWSTDGIQELFLKIECCTCFLNTRNEGVIFLGKKRGRKKKQSDSLFLSARISGFCETRIQLSPSLGPKTFFLWVCVCVCGCRCFYVCIFFFLSDAHLFYSNSRCLELLSVTLRSLVGSL